MGRTALMVMVIAAIAVVAALVLTAPRKPGVDPAETSAVQTE